MFALHQRAGRYGGLHGGVVDWRDVPEFDTSGQLVTAVVDDRSSFIELAVAGVWDRELRLRADLMIGKCLASHPAAIVVDLLFLDDPDQASVPMWLSLQVRGARMMPAVPIAVCARDGSPMADGLAWRGGRFGPPLFADPAQARKALTSGLPMTDQVRRWLPPKPQSATSARRLVVAACEQWRLAAAVATRAQLVVSQLVVNAVEHAGTPIEVVVTRIGSRRRGGVLRPAAGVHVAVYDLDPRLPPGWRDNLQESPPPRRRGQGLDVIAADFSGVLPTRQGKMIWAILRNTR
ncbi:ATP-binding protein [Actinoplanes sp. CA-030573]|uniref:ATP-binding protein n=1 Tax=Actinoplanes sp. CA-030573 TaxID=3239898 RepID=UPI003D8A1002